MKRFLVVLVLVSVLLSLAQTPAQAGGPILESSSDHRQLNFSGLPSGNFDLTFGISGQNEIKKNYTVGENNILNLDVVSEIGLSKARLMVSINPSVSVTSYSDLWKANGFWLMLSPSIVMNPGHDCINIGSSGLYPWSFIKGKAGPQETIIVDGMASIPTGTDTVSFIAVVPGNTKIFDNLAPFWIPDPNSDWHVKNPNLTPIDVKIDGVPRSLHLSSVGGQEIQVIASIKGEYSVFNIKDQVFNASNWDIFAFAPIGSNDWIRSQIGSSFLVGFTYIPGGSISVKDPGYWMNLHLNIREVYLPSIFK